MKGRAFLVTAIGTVACGAVVGGVIAGVEDGIGESPKWFFVGGVFALFLAPFVGIVAVLVYWPVERWLRRRGLDEQRSRRVCAAVGGVLGPVLAVVGILVLSGGETLGLGWTVALVIIAAVIGTLGGGLIWKRPVAPAA